MEKVMISGERMLEIARGKTSRTQSSWLIQPPEIKPGVRRDEIE
jgi:hypothetical protein